MISVAKALWSLYDRKEKQYLVALVLLTLALAGMELLAAGAFFFYTNILADTNLVVRNPKLQAIYRLGGFQGIQPFLLFLGLVVFAVLVVRGVLSVANMYCQSRFSAHMRNGLSDRILRTY